VCGLESSTAGWERSEAEKGGKYINMREVAHAIDWFIFFFTPIAPEH
jgi:hypothetical protein